MTDLPPELGGFTDFRFTGRSQLRDVLSYCLCLIMVESGKMELVETLPGEEGAICIFYSSAGKTFTITKLNISENEVRALMDFLRVMMDDEGL